MLPEVYVKIISPLGLVFGVFLFVCFFNQSNFGWRKEKNQMCQGLLGMEYKLGSMPTNGKHHAESPAKSGAFTSQVTYGVLVQTGPVSLKIHNGRLTWSLRE